MVRIRKSKNYSRFSELFSTVGMGIVYQRSPDRTDRRLVPDKTDSLS